MHTDIDIKAKSADKSGKKQILKFVHDLREELKKVSWTTKDELKFFTQLVIGTIFAFGFAIYVIDLSIKGSLDLLHFVFRFLFG